MNPRVAVLSGKLVVEDKLVFIIYTLMRETEKLVWLFPSNRQLSRESFIPFKNVKDELAFDIF
jgi:hypothetical protein